MKLTEGGLLVPGSDIDRVAIYEQNGRVMIDITSDVPYEGELLDLSKVEAWQIVGKLVTVLTSDMVFTPKDVWETVDLKEASND